MKFQLIIAISDKLLVLYGGTCLSVFSAGFVFFREFLCLFFGLKKMLFRAF